MVTPDEVQVARLRRITDANARGAAFHRRSRLLMQINIMQLIGAAPLALLFLIHARWYILTAATISVIMGALTVRHVGKILRSTAGILPPAEPINPTNQRRHPLG
jgi:hypothetical protein